MFVVPVYSGKTTGRVAIMGDLEGRSGGDLHAGSSLPATTQRHFGSNSKPLCVAA